MSKHSAGKGSKYRPVDKKQYDKNYDAIFKKPKKKKQPKYSVGDIVYYNDPKDSLCSCHGTIIEISNLLPDATVTLNTMVYGYIGCSLSELTKVK